MNTENRTNARPLCPNIISKDRNCIVLNNDQRRQNYQDRLKWWLAHVEPSEQVSAVSAPASLATKAETTISNISRILRRQARAK